MTPIAPVPVAAADPLTALVVQRGPDDIRFAVSILESNGFLVSVAEGFSQAKALIDRHVPDVLVTDVRLHDYNGLHLVLRGKGIRPSMAAVVVTAIEDPVIQVEAERMGATFVLQPTTRQEFMAAVFRTLFRVPGDARPIRARFERRSGDRRGAVKLVVDSERRLNERRTRPWRVVGHRDDQPATPSDSAS